MSFGFFRKYFDRFLSEILQKFLLSFNFQFSDLRIVKYEKSSGLERREKFDFYGHFTRIFSLKLFASPS